MTSSATERSRTSAPSGPGGASIWIWAALAAAGLAVVGSLILSLALGLKACPLCFYQRAFAMSLVAVLGMGLGARVQRERLGWLALPLATAGVGVALFHVSLELRGKLDCPAGLLGLGSAPQQSLAIFAVVFALLLVDVVRSGAGKGRWLGLASGLVLGALLAVGSCVANPPLPKAEPYTKPPDMCRPPFGG